MAPSLVIPLVAATLLALVVTSVHRLLPPVFAARLVALTAGVVVIATVPTVWLVGLGYLAHTPFVGSGFLWCAKMLGLHQAVPAWLGVPAVAAAGFGAVRSALVVRSHRRLRHDRPGRIEIAGDARAFAYTLPGAGGRLVLSSGLVELLDDRETAVVIAHEQAHARFRHDRYLLLAQVAAAISPVLRPVSSRLRYSLERWADETAVEGCGDRTLVARTLAKVALVGPAPTGALAVAGLGVPARVAALLAPRRQRPSRIGEVLLSSTIAATVVLTVVQLHHLTHLVAVLCPG
jgi:Zn-dependent protease with chaperone function